jgi:hypothetical protein
VRMALIAAVAASSMLTASPASASRDMNTFGAEAALSANGRIAEVTVILRCTQEERVHLRVTLTQGNASGLGVRSEACHATVTEYSVVVVAGGPASFVAGNVQACAEAVTRDHGVVTDSWSWCRPGGVTLAE